MAFQEVRHQVICRSVLKLSADDGASFLLQRAGHSQAYQPLTSGPMALDLASQRDLGLYIRRIDPDFQAPEYLELQASEAITSRIGEWFKGWARSRWTVSEAAAILDRYYIANPNVLHLGPRGQRGGSLENGCYVARRDIPAAPASGPHPLTCFLNVVCVAVDQVTISRIEADPSLVWVPTSAIATEGMHEGMRVGPLAKVIAFG